MTETLRENVARALWRLECEWATLEEIKAGRQPPERWADPWHPSGCGVRQQKSYLTQADRAIAGVADHLGVSVEALEGGAVQEAVEELDSLIDAVDAHHAANQRVMVDPHSLEGARAALAKLRGE